jgi:quinol monooxygenase YgiN
MLVLNRFVVQPDAQDGFVTRAHAALAALAERPGYLSGRLTRAIDEPTSWTLVTEWESVGAYRRALGHYEVKLRATPLLAQSVDQPSAFEALLVVDADGRRTVRSSDRAVDADWVARSPGRDDRS